MFTNLVYACRLKVYMVLRCFGLSPEAPHLTSKMRRSERRAGVLHWSDFTAKIVQRVHLFVKELLYSKRTG